MNNKVRGTVSNIYNDTPLPENQAETLLASGLKSSNNV